MLMRRLTIATAAASAAMLGFGAAGASAETVVKKKQFETTVSAAFAQTSPTGEEYTNPSGTFSGKLASSKNKCIKGRGVTVQPPNAPNLGHGTSNNGGDWSLQASNLTPGQYSVEVGKLKIIKEKDKPNGTHVKKKIVCLPATATVAVP
jgi:hypothetical protein